MGSCIRPLEQRLAIYLAKQFTSQSLHRRFVRDLARVLPIEAGRDRDARRILAEAGDGLVRAGLPILASFRLVPSASGDWLAEFRRGAKAADIFTVPRPAGGAVSAAVAESVLLIADAVGGDDDRVWWERCAERLGRGRSTAGSGC